MKNTYLLLACLVILGCQPENSQKSPSTDDYLSFANRDDQSTGGIKMIPISTPKGEFKVWTKRVGNNPTMKVLLLHGGPGGTHEEFECYDGFFPVEGKTAYRKIHGSRARYFYLIGDMKKARRYFRLSGFTLKTMAYYLTTFAGSGYVKKKFNIFG